MARCFATIASGCCSPLTPPGRRKATRRTPSCQTPFGRLTVGICMDLNDDRFTDGIFGAAKPAGRRLLHQLARSGQRRPALLLYRLRGFAGVFAAANTYGGETSPATPPPALRSLDDLFDGWSGARSRRFGGVCKPHPAAFKSPSTAARQRTAMPSCWSRSKDRLRPYPAFGWRGLETSWLWLIRSSSPSEPGR